MLVKKLFDLKYTLNQSMNIRTYIKIKKSFRINLNATNRI